MKNVSKILLPLAFIGIITVSLAFISWDTDSTKTTKPTAISGSIGKPVIEFKFTDTPKNQSRIEIQKALAQVDSALKEVNKQLAAINFTDIDKQVKLALSQVDMSSIQKTVNDALKNVDFKSIQEEVNKSMKDAKIEMDKIDWNSVQAEINAGMKEMQNELKGAQFEMAEAMKELSKQNLVDAKQMQLNAQKALEDAKVSLAKAKVELKEVENFTNELEKDKLIDKKKGYTVEVKDGKLIINGIEQSKEVNRKYKKFLKKNRTFNTNNKEVLDL